MARLAKIRLRMQLLDIYGTVILKPSLVELCVGIFYPAWIFRRRKRHWFNLMTDSNKKNILCTKKDYLMKLLAAGICRIESGGWLIWSSGRMVNRVEWQDG
jgi:hypothetical protein